MSDINFSNIRTHNGSKASGFEELVCQLARLQKPENAEEFVRKGEGGDAGVECYWRLTDGSEICWQAKYFPDGMNPSQWSQLDKSFTTALERHPNLTKYIICIPLDRPDSRRRGKGGQQVISVQDTWNARVDQWTVQAQEKGRSVEFEYWGKSEITNFLTIDSPLYSGKALYWFNELILNSEKFRHIVDKAQEALGERYTPEFHVDLAIARMFDGLCLNDQWWEDLEEKIAELNKHKEQFFKTFIEDKPELLDTEKVKDLRAKCSSVFSILSDRLNQRDRLFDVQDVLNRLKEILAYEDNVKESYTKNIQGQDDRNTPDRIFSGFFGMFHRFSQFLKSPKVKAAETKAALLYGEAGIGKSYLLCDISLQRIDNSQPTIFLLGSQYKGGNPIELIKASLDLQTYSDTQVLGAIDAAGEASGARVLIVIDAINEGLHREDWENHISHFLSDISEFKNIAIVLSCRSTYLDYILPDHIDKDRLVHIQHFGFHVHRAAEQYLSMQGIATPSAPILAPEFTNPLFLKTCCKALKENGQTSFPKGLYGITSLFDFYLQSIERTVAKHKRYKHQEKIVERALLAFSSKLFPEHLIGIPTREARTLFKKHDPNENVGDTLLNRLLHEGILSEDILYTDEPVIRFTYDRFSDLFIAQQLLEQYNSETIDSIFCSDQSLGRIVLEHGYYRYAGIFEALAIIIPEQYKKELVDLLPKDADIHKGYIGRIFTNTIVWRDPNSFSSRTLELLNQLKSFVDNILLGSRNLRLDILLKLSTEPSHPWNAELLDHNLSGKKMAERDAFWSTHVAFGYASEEDASIVKTLIEWSCFGNIDTAEEERIRLCAITLLWFLTTSNRKVRDRATKALVRILSRYPSLLPDLLRRFHAVNDLYVVERLYAVVYGVVCNIDDAETISCIAVLVFDLVFKDGKPIPHILLRDYARGILELALDKELLPDDVDPVLFRPPYKSEWPLENPTEEEIDNIIGDEEFSQISNSLMGSLLGDFGNYTMGCVHDWSSTPLSVSSPETGYDLKKDFAEKYLHGEVKAAYLEEIKPYLPEMEEEIADTPFLQEEVTPLWTLIYKEEFKFEEEIKAQIPDDKRETYRWLSGLGSDRPAAFSRKWAQRWVCKRAYALGWTKELFYDFEKMWCSYGRWGGVYEIEAMERVGKKYQWIALHEFLAHLSDNVHWIGSGYRDTEDEHYDGPWQIRRRDIDPTIWMRKNGEYRSFHNEVSTWWQPYKFPFDGLNDIRDQQTFVLDEQKVPDFQNLLRIKEPDTHNHWTVLQGFWSEIQSQSSSNGEYPRFNCWFRINSAFIRKKDYELVVENLKDGSFLHPNIIYIPSQYQSYLGEYPWHPIYKSMSGWQDPDGVDELISTKYFVPVSEYNWESKNEDYSLDISLSFYLPAQELVEGLGLRRSAHDPGSWENDDGVVFRDPSIEQYGPSYALMDSQTLDDWLSQNELEILWLIGGEKLLYSSNTGSRESYERLIYNGLFRLVKGKPTGTMRFQKR